MKFFYWIVFVPLLGGSLGFSSKDVNVSREYSDTKILSEGGGATAKATSKREIDLPVDTILPQEGVDGTKLKVLVIKKTEIKSLVDSIKKKYKEYAAVNRYERIDKTPSGVKKGQLKIKLTRDIGASIDTIDKPLVLGGEGFDTAGFEPDNNRLHFTFNSHIKAPPFHEIKREDTAGQLDSSFERSRSKKFLIFHDGGSSFGRQSNFFLESNLGQSIKEKTIHTKTEPTSDAGIDLGQNEEAKAYPDPAEKSLDLIYDHPAILKYNYQMLNSSGS